MNLIVTAGGTTEKIDDVRVISNNSTGRLGMAIANSLTKNFNEEIDKIYYVCGYNALVPKEDKIEAIRIGGVDELAAVLKELLEKFQIDGVIHSMAVSDYSVNTLTTSGNVEESILAVLKESQKEKLSEAELAAKIVKAAFMPKNSLKSERKISSNLDDFIITMKKTPKVISTIKAICPSTVLIGFKLLSNVDTEKLIDVGYELLQKNDCDYVFANDLKDISKDNHIGYLISRDKEFFKLEGREEIAEEISKKTVQKIKMKKGESV